MRAQLSPLGPRLAPGLIGEPVGPVVHCFRPRGWEAELIWQAEAGEREVLHLGKALRQCPRRHFLLSLEIFNQESPKL